MVSWLAELLGKGQPRVRGKRKVCECVGLWVQVNIEIAAGRDSFPVIRYSGVLLAQATHDKQRTEGRCGQADRKPRACPCPGSRQKISLALNDSPLGPRPTLSEPLEKSEILSPDILITT